MEDFLCALEFERDGNLCGRAYWYRSGVALSVGDLVAAPVGARNKLQAGRVKKILPLSEGDSVYRAGPLKQVVCRYGYRKISLPAAENVRDLGGLYYDEKHLTAYGNFWRGGLPKEDVAPFGVDAVFCFGGKDAVSSCRVSRFPSLLKRETAKGGRTDAADIVLSSLAEFSLFQALCSALAAEEGTVLLCDEDGAGDVDLVCMLLYLLCGVAPANIAKDYAFSVFFLRRKNPQNVNAEAGNALPFPERDFCSAVRAFCEEYGGAAAYLGKIGLSQDEIARLTRRMQRLAY